MELTLGNITFDCANPRALATFWSGVVGHPVDPPIREGQTFMASINASREGGPTYLFLKVSEPKIAKNRVHMDWHCGDRHAEVIRLTGLGATVVGEYHEWGSHWTTLRDPEGNEFCGGGPC